MMSKYLLTEVGDYAGAVAYILLKLLCVLVLCVISIHTFVGRSPDEKIRACHINQAVKHHEKKMF